MPPSPPFGSMLPSSPAPPSSPVPLPNWLSPEEPQATTIAAKQETARARLIMDYKLARHAPSPLNVNSVTATFLLHRRRCASKGHHGNHSRGIFCHEVGRRGSPSGRT